MATSTRSFAVTVRPADTPISFYPLELVLPRQAGTAPSTDAGIVSVPSGHFIFFAHPNVPYEFEPVIKGGAFPYTLELLNAPAGMVLVDSVNDDGFVVKRIRWPNPAGTVTPSLRVTDAAGTVREEPWTIVTTTADWKFFSPSGNDTTGDGSFASPWQTLVKAQTSTANQRCVFRAGTYSFQGIPVTVMGDGNQRAQWGPGRGSSIQLIAFPGETVEFDHGYQAGVAPGIMVEVEPPAYSASAQPVFFSGFTSRNVANSLWRLQVQGHYHYFDLTFRDIWEPTGGANPAGLMFVTGGGAMLRQYVYLHLRGLGMNYGQGCGVFKMYSCRRPIVIISADGCRGPGDFKFCSVEFEARGWRVRNSNFDGMDFFGNLHADETVPTYCSGELRYSLIDRRNFSATAMALDVNQDGQAKAIQIYRNTLLGRVQVRNTTTPNGPFTLMGNVIENTDGTYQDRVLLYAVSDPSRILYANNLSGSAADGMVDANGRLQGAFRTAHFGSRGHELP